MLGYCLNIDSIMPLNDKITHPSDICLVIMCALPELIKNKPQNLFYHCIILNWIRMKRQQYWML